MYWLIYFVSTSSHSFYFFIYGSSLRMGSLEIWQIVILLTLYYDALYGE